MRPAGEQGRNGKQESSEKECSATPETVSEYTAEQSTEKTANESTTVGPADQLSER